MKHKTKKIIKNNLKNNKISWTWFCSCGARGTKKTKQEAKMYKTIHNIVEKEETEFKKETALNAKKILNFIIEIKHNDLQLPKEAELAFNPPFGSACNPKWIKDGHELPEIYQYITLANDLDKIKTLVDSL